MTALTTSIVSEVLRTNELQVWFLSEHLVNVPLVETREPSATEAAQQHIAGTQHEAGSDLWATTSKCEDRTLQVNISVSLYGHQEFKPTAQPPRVPDTDSDGHILPQYLQALCPLAIGVLPLIGASRKLEW